MDSIEAQLQLYSALKELYGEKKRDNQFVRETLSRLSGSNWKMFLEKARDLGNPYALALSWMQSDGTRIDLEHRKEYLNLAVAEQEPMALYLYGVYLENLTTHNKERQAHYKDLGKRMKEQALAMGFVPEERHNKTYTWYDPDD